VYRYFRTTEDLLRATALDATGAFFDRLDAHLRARPLRADEAVVESIAFTIEALPHDPYMSLLLTPSRISLLGTGFTQPIATTLGRAMVDRFPVDWDAEGFTSDDLDDLVEHMLRVTQSLVFDPGTPPRTGDALRAYLDRWVAPAVIALSGQRHGS
jgi:AcrR family transcriptional regulator